jgi:hypothetical protein
MKRNKNDARPAFMDLVYASPTWADLTPAERDRVYMALAMCRERGDYETRWQKLEDVYFACIIGLGYDRVCWRKS